MPYAYQTTGLIDGSMDEILAISKKYRDRMDSIDGIMHRIVMKVENDDIACSIYVCVDKVSALKVQTVMQDIMSEAGEMAPFFTEYIFEIVESELFPQNLSTR